MLKDDRDSDNTVPDSVDHLIISLRAYAAATKGAKSRGKPRRSPSDWVLVFDCETRTTPDQRLRFGAYQLRHKRRLIERGTFYEPEAISPTEITLLQRTVAAEKYGPEGERIRMLSRADFVDQVLFDSAYNVGAQIVGFNLPFDLSRLAIDFDSARKMPDAFTLLLTKNRPRITVKHLSQRAAFIQVVGGRPEKNKRHNKNFKIDRGYFVDVKTLAATLTSASHSLESLSRHLQVPTPKQSSDEHGAVLTPEYIDYALRDVQTTWECFDALAKKVDSLALKDKGLFDLYSEASLGKALLSTMNVKP